MYGPSLGLCIVALRNLAVHEIRNRGTEIVCKVIACLQASRTYVCYNSLMIGGYTVYVSVDVAVCTTLAINQRSVNVVVGYTH